jgi:hypothetical protein
VKRMRFGIVILFSVILLISSIYYPAFGMEADHPNQAVLSGAMYTFHTVNKSGDLLPEGTCLLCHPGPGSQSLSESLALMGVGCTDCHDGMSALDTPQHMTGIRMLTCTSCHGQDVKMAILIDSAGSQGENFSSSTDLTQSINENETSASADPSHVIKELTSFRSLAAVEKLSQAQLSHDTAQACEVCHARGNQATFWHLGSEE